MLEIYAKTRKEKGRQVKSLRRDGVLPAVLYGGGVASVPLSVSVKEFERVLREAGETSLVVLKLENDKAYNVLIHEVAQDPRTLQPIHADFYAVRMDKPIEAKIPLVFTGESPAVKNEGGVLVKVLKEIEVRALPNDLPHEISIPLGVLAHIEDRIFVKDLAVSRGVTVLTHAEEVVALVEAPIAEAEVPAAEAVAPVEVKTEREVKAEVNKKKEAAEETPAGSQP